MLLERNKSCLLLVDVQKKLTPHVMEPDGLINRCNWLMKLASRLNVPTLISEQYPVGLGETVAPLDAYMTEENRIDKIHFSCYSDSSFKKKWNDINRTHAVIAGIETHVCVLQTAMELHHAEYKVFVVVDAVSSRHELDHRTGLERMQQSGIQLITREMVFFEWIKQAGTSDFKRLSQEFLRSDNDFR